MAGGGRSVVLVGFVGWVQTIINALSADTSLIVRPYHSTFTHVAYVASGTSFYVIVFVVHVCIRLSRHLTYKTTIGNAMLSGFSLRLST